MSWFWLVPLLLCAGLLGDRGRVEAFFGCSYEATRQHSLYTRSTTIAIRMVSTEGVASQGIDAVSDIKSKLEELISSTDRGRSCSDDQQAEIKQWLEKLSALSTFEEPNRSPLTGGEWIVQYTTAPPPSNGILGPFKGGAQQAIDMQQGTYQNILLVPPNDWLSAVLDATYEEWDGALLPDEDGNTPQDEKGREKNKDYGGTCWKVTFERLVIKLFGLPIVTQTFDNVQRIWRTSFLDDHTRVVWAGRTGKRDDEMVFYMTRAKP